MSNMGFLWMENKQRKILGEQQETTRGILKGRPAHSRLRLSSPGREQLYVMQLKIPPILLLTIEQTLM